MKYYKHWSVHNFTPSFKTFLNVKYTMFSISSPFILHRYSTYIGSCSCNCFDLTDWSSELFRQCVFPLPPPLLFYIDTLHTLEAAAVTASTWPTGPRNCSDSVGCFLFSILPLPPFVLHWYSTYIESCSCDCFDLTDWSSVFFDVLT